MRLVDIQKPSKLKPFFERKKRFKIAYGGRAGAKSQTYGTGFSVLGYLGFSIACFREYKDSIKKSVHPLIAAQIEKYNIPGYTILKTEIKNKSGGEFQFMGLSRSLESVKSMFGFTFFWLEEGQFVSEESLRILTPTLRETDSELWISANPLSSNDPFSKRFIVPYINQLEKTGYYEDDLHMIVKINYSDNPWFPASLEQERQFDKKHLSRAMYEHVWEGAFNDSVDDSIIKAEWFDSAINAHERLGFKPTGIKVCSFDPSDTGEDDKGLVVRHGSVIIEAKNREYGDINEGCDWAISTAIEKNIDLFTWDVDGMGVGLKRQISEAFRGKKIRHKPFSGANKPDFEKQIYEPVENCEERQKTNEDVFKNKRAQYYWMLRDRFFNTYLAVEKGKYIDPDKMISISPDIDDLRLLRSETCRIPRVYNNQGKIQIMTKKDMKRIKIQSPNLADSLMMSLVADDPIQDRYTPMEFESVY